MKRPIEWHEECLRNSLRTAEDERQRLDNMRQRVDRLDQSNAILKAQIERARREGKDGFDSEKYNKQR